MASIEKLTPGQILFTVWKHKMGNTHITTVSVHAVKVISVSDDGRSVVASWNGSQPKTYWELAVSKWRVKKPQLVDIGLGAKRLARRSDREPAK